jgi:hypothetical protein
VRLTKEYFSLLGGASYKGYILPRMLRSAANVFDVFPDTFATYQSCRNEQIDGMKSIGLDHTMFGLHSGVPQVGRI